MGSAMTWCGWRLRLLHPRETCRMNGMVLLDCPSTALLKCPKSYFMEVKFMVA